MTDLASRLRTHADEVLDPGYPYYGTPEMAREAADEIERLRLTNGERQAIMRAMYKACGADSETMWQLLERTKARC